MGWLLDSQVLVGRCLWPLMVKVLLAAAQRELWGSRSSPGCPSTPPPQSAQVTCGLSSKERVGMVGCGGGLGSQFLALQIQFLFKKKHIP